MADESKYLEENYDGDAEQRDAQRAEDIENAKKMAQEVEEVQQRAYEIFEDECIDLIGISGTRFEELMKKSDESDALHQYLVDGALLTCTQATLEDFILPGTGIFFLTEVISLDQVDEEDEEEQQKQPVDLGTRCQRLQTKLNVPENPMGVNGQPYATVKDNIKGGNSGVCQYLMRLNEEWDNMLLDEGKKYLMRRDIKPDEDRPDGKDTDGEDVEGITRTSVLFCKHGGLIVPLTSGQDVVKPLFLLEQLEISTNPIALYNTSLEPAHLLRSLTQGKIQKLCNNEIIYFDPNGYQRVKNTGLASDPYLVAIGEYYSSSAVSNGVGDYQGYGAIFKVTYTSGKEIYVTMGDLKDPQHTKTAMEQEGKNYYAGYGDSANTLEFICNYLNKNTENYSENMSGSKGSDANRGNAYTITEGASISEIDLLIGKEIEWEKYFENDN